jgi:hypothetical protein
MKITPLKNYEIRFPTSKQVYEISKELHKFFNEWKRLAFFEKIYLKGLQSFKEDVRKQNEQTK